MEPPKNPSFFHPNHLHVFSGVQDLVALDLSLQLGPPTPQFPQLNTLEFNGQWMTAALQLDRPQQSLASSESSVNQPRETQLSSSTSSELSQFRKLVRKLNYNVECTSDTQSFSSPMRKVKGDANTVPKSKRPRRQSPEVEAEAEGSSLGILEVVHFRALERPKEDDFCLELAKNHTYDDVVERVAHRLGLDDTSKIRLTPHNWYLQQPMPNFIKYRSVDHLRDMLVHYNQFSDILYYEVLDIPLPELQCLKTLKVAFHYATKDEVVILNVRLPKLSTVEHVLNEIKTKVELSKPNVELRLLEVFYHKICKIFPLNEKIENISDQYWTLRAEEIPEEEKNHGPRDRLIHVYHFTKTTAQNSTMVQNFGEPFFLVIREVETLAEVKVRIQKKLQVPDEEFSRWKFAFLSLGRPEYLQDTDTVSSHFQRRVIYGDWEQYLGLEHSDTTPKRAYVSNQNRHAYEKPVKIYN